MYKGHVIADNHLAIICEVTIDSLRARQSVLAVEIQVIIDAADDLNRDINDSEIEVIAGKKKQIDALTRQIEARAPSVSNPGRVTSADPTTGRTPAGSVQVGIVRNRGTHDFASFGEFLITVRRQAVGDETASVRLLNAASTYGSEGAGADGGFAIPPDFRAEIWQKVMGEDSLLALCEQFTTNMNHMTFPKDETTPWQTSGGIQCAWESEMGVIGQSKVSLQMETIRLTKLTALVPVSDELLEDAPGIESYLRIKVPTKMVSKINNGLIRGTGVGQPLGLLNHKSVVTVTPETSQDVATILYKNIVNMWSRMYGPSRGKSVWLVNQDCEPQLFNLAFRENASSPVPAYLPANGLSGSPYATLMGRPVIPVEPCSTVGTIGDIILVDWTQYMALTKGSLRTDMSMHLYFDQAATAFRFIMRINGQPLWGSSITPENGSMTRSWAVVLDTRP